MIYTVGGLKRGVGKTTTSLNLALYLANEEDRDVLFIDTEKDSCATEFMRWRSELTNEDNLTIVELHDISLYNQIDRLKEKFDDVIIDAGAGNALKFSLQKAGRFIAPFPSNDPDIMAVWNLSKLERLVEEAMEVNENLQSYTFLMRASNIESENDNEAEVLEKSELLHYIDAPVFNQRAFNLSLIAGYSIFDYHPRNDTAIAQMHHLFNEFVA